MQDPDLSSFQTFINVINTHEKYDFGMYKVSNR